jgi:hypothetical protein
VNFATHPVVYILWIAIMITQAYVLALLAGRNGYREYPAFTTFIAFCVARSTVLFYLSHFAERLYLPVLWLAYVPQFIILIAFVLEVFYVIFHPFQTLPPHTIRRFATATIVIAVIAVALTLRFPGAQPTAWMTFARAIDQLFTWVLTLIFGLIVLFAKYFGIPWRHRIQGIAVGFLTYLSADVVVTTIVAQRRLPPYSPVWSLNMVAFLLACVTWVWYFSTDEVPRTPPTADDIRRIQAALQKLASAVRGVTMNGSETPAPAAAFIQFRKLQIQWRKLIGYVR